MLKKNDNGGFGRRISLEFKGPDDLDFSSVRLVFRIF